jgi:NitT/TauT family transport system substrate-binding protein
MTKFLAAAGLAAALATGSVHAQSKIQIGCTATSDCASAMVAVDEGIFKKSMADSIWSQSPARRS